jgi:hypothetical protein
MLSPLGLETLHMRPGPPNSVSIPPTMEKVQVCGVQCVQRSGHWCRNFGTGRARRPPHFPQAVRSPTP